MKSFRTLITRGNILRLHTFRDFATEIPLTSNSSLHSVFSSYKTLPDSKVRYDSIVQSFDSRAKGSKYEVISYLNRSIGAVSLAELIRRDIRINHKIKTSSSSTVVNSTTVSINFLDSILKEWLDVVLCDDALELQEITFESSSGYILQKIMQGEAVHTYKQVSELKRRLCRGRHCYALLHHSMPNDPIVFIHVALTETIAHVMSDMKFTTTPQCAIFYSVNSPYSGYGGLDLAGRLIDRVTAKLKHDYPSVETFCTLSPLPSFITWLKSLLSKSVKAKEIMRAMPLRLKTDLYSLARCNTGFTLPPSESASVSVISDLNEIHDVGATGSISSNNNDSSSSSSNNGTSTLNNNSSSSSNNNNNNINSSNSNNSSTFNSSSDTREELIDPGLRWLITTVSSKKCVRNNEVMTNIKDVMLWLGCYYITKEFKGVQKLPADEVARFHMRRGASFHRLNWAANDSVLSMESSTGMMVNYLYHVSPSSSSTLADDISSQNSSNTTTTSTSIPSYASATTNDGDDDIEFLRKNDISKRSAIAKENVMNIPLGRQVTGILNDSSTISSSSCSSSTISSGSSNSSSGSSNSGSSSSTSSGSTISSSSSTISRNSDSSNRR